MAITQTPFRFRLDSSSGVPVYRQLIDQVQAGIATGVLTLGHQLPTVRQVAVDLAINPNTVMRAYRELEIRACSTPSKAPARSSPPSNRRSMATTVPAASIKWSTNSSPVPAPAASH